MKLFSNKDVMPERAKHPVRNRKAPGGVGYSHIKTYRDIGSVFGKKFLDMGPIFLEKIPNYGFDYQNFPGFA